MTKDQGLYNRPSAAVRPGTLATGTLPQYNTILAIAFKRRRKILRHRNKQGTGLGCSRFYWHLERSTPDSGDIETHPYRLNRLIKRRGIDEHQKAVNLPYHNTPGFFLISMEQSLTQSWQGSKCMRVWGVGRRHRSSQKSCPSFRLLLRGL